MKQPVQASFTTDASLAAASSRTMNLRLKYATFVASAITLLLILLTQSTGFSQSVSFTSSPNGSATGNACTSPSVSFSGSVTPASTQVSSANFNSGSLPSGWGSTGFTSSVCSNTSPDNSNYWWATTNSGGVRWLQTGSVNVSNGGTVQFYIRYGASGDPCEELDGADEVVNLQYSTNGGSTWTTFDTWDAITNSAWYSGWYYESTDIPAGARTSSTLFRWYQAANSGDALDHWGVESVVINAYQATPSITSWSWNFGDATTGSGQNVSHTFPNIQGTNSYTVTLTATSSAGPTYTSSSSYSVTINGTNPTSGGTVGSDQCGASGFNPGLITSTALPSGQSGALEYKWQQSTTSATTGFADIASTNSTTYDPPPVTQTTWYRRLSRVVCMTSWTGAAESNAVRMLVDATPPVLTCPANITADNNTTSSTFAVTYSTPTYTDNCSASGTPSLTSGIASGGLFPYGTTTNTFSLTDAAGNTGTCSFTVFVQQALPDSVTAKAATSIAGTSFTANWYASTGPTTAYLLDVSTDINFGSYLSGYQDLNVGNVLSYSVTGLSPGVTYYYRVSVLNARGTSIESNLIGVVTINCNDPSNGGTIGSDQCGLSGYNPVTLNGLTLPSGFNGVLEYKWQKSTTSSTSGFSDIGSTDAPSYDPPAITQTTWYKRLSRVACSGSWATAAESNVVEVSIGTNDQSPPAVTCPSNMTVNAPTGTCAAVANYSLPTYTDNCSPGPVSGSYSFSYTGGVQTWTVPAGVTYVDIQAWGAQGGNGGSSLNPGGQGGYASGRLSVTPGDVLQIYVGGQGVTYNGGDNTNAGGFNGGGNGGYDWTSPTENGGGGGGATDVRIGGVKKIVAAGGGGGGGGYYVPGGAGGGLTGNNGTSYIVSFGGGGGSQAGGGSAYTGFDATWGSFGQGGQGATGSFWGSGGGGGGYYGGGGGSAGAVHGSGYAAGGGGGSSFIGGVTNGSTSTGGRNGDGYLAFSYNINLSTLVSGQASGTSFPVGVTTNVYSVTDNANNTGTCSFRVTVRDITVPSFTDPADVTLYTDTDGVACPANNSVSPAASQSVPVATGGNAFTFTVNGVTRSGPTTYSDLCFSGSNVKLYLWAVNLNRTGTTSTCNRQIELTWRVYDADNNYTEQNQIYTIVDRTVPTFTRPADGTFPAPGCTYVQQLPAVTGDVTNESDNCQTGLNATWSDGAPTAGACPGTFTVNRTWSLVDGCGNAAASQVQVITIAESTVPTVSSTNSPNDPDIDNYACGASFTYNAGPSTCFINKTVAKPSWTDACGGTITRAQSADNGVVLSNYGDFVGANFPVGTTIVTFSATECAGNTGYCTLSITVNDTQNPTITGCPTNQTALTDPDSCSRILNLVIPTAGDNCSVSAVTYATSGATTLSGTEFPNPLKFNVGVTTVVYRAFDAAGNSRSCTFAITINDPVPPVARCKNAAAQLNSLGTVTIPGSLLDNGSTDNCSLTFTPVPATFTCASLGANTVTLNVSDGSNTRTCTAVVTVQDVTPPAAICKNKTLSLNSSGSATLAVTDIDNNSTDACGITSRSLSKTAYTCADLGTSTVTLTLADGSGNSGSCSGTVTVQDVTSPTALCKNITVSLSGSSVSVTASQVNNGSTDNCAVSSMSLSTTAFTCANRGNNNVTLSVFDASGNVGTCSAVVTVQDATPPVASCRDVSVNLTGNTASITAAQVNNSSTDNCSIASTTVSPSTFNCTNTSSTVTLTVTDGSGNSSTCTSTVTVNDVTLPTITTCPSNQTISNCIAPGYTGNVVATDNCSIASITQSPAAGVSLGIGHGQSTSITYTVTDNSGNVRTCSNTVTVNDQTPPTATCNNLTVTLDPVSNQATVTTSQLTVNSADDCNPVTSIAPAWRPSPGSCAGAVCLSGGASFPALRNGGGTITYTRTNCLGSSRNESWFYFQVTSPGTINQTISISPSSDVDYACWGPFSGVANGCASLGTATQVACDYSGANGGTMNFAASTGYYIMVVSNFGNQAGNITLSSNSGTAAVGVCSSMSGTETSYVYNQTNLGQNTVTVQVTDAAGNSSTCNAVVTVQVNDPVPPVALCQDVSVSLDVSNSATIRASDIDGGSTDNVAVSAYSLSKTSFNCSNIGANVVALTVSDPNGNTATCNSVVTVNDVTVPVFADPADVTLTTNAAAECPSPASITLVASQSTPVATNNTAFSYTVHGKAQSGPTSYSDNCATGSDLKLYCWAIDDDFTGTADKCFRQIQITWRVYDKNNANYTEQTQRFTINDNTIPTFTRPADITINTASNCTPDLLPSNTGDVLNEDDNCSNASSVTLVSPDDPLSAGIPSDTRHCVTTVASQNVTFDWSYSTVDLDPTHDPFGYSVNGVFTLLIDDFGALTQSGSEVIPVPAGAEFCLIQHTIDNRGGSATTVVDRFKALQLLAATYSDGTHVNLGCPGEFYFDRTWSLSDDCGNAAASQVQRITVRDRTAPVVTTTNNSLDPDIDNYTCGVSYTFNAGPQICFLSKTIAKPEWSDACGGTVTKTQSATNNVTVSNYGSFVSVDFPVGTTTVTFRAQDCPGNTAVCSVTVTIVDNQAPILTGCPQNQTWVGDPNACDKTVTLVIPTAGDNCAVTTVTHTLSGATTLVDNEFPNQLDLNYGVTSIVYAAFDAAGNSATCSFSVTVTDPLPPSITCPANTTVVADAGVCYHTAAAGLFDPVVTDNCPITPIYTVFGTTSASGSGSLNGVQFNRGLSTVTWSATDQSSASTSCSFIVRVNDAEPPSVPADAGSAVACLAAATAPVIPSATDNCSGSVNVELLSVVDNPASLTCEGTRTYTYEYSDDSGNIASDKWVYTYTIEYQDFTMPANSGSTVACVAAVTQPTPPSVNDNCGNAITPTGPVTGGTYTSCEGTYTYTWTYTDCEGNSHPWVYTWTIEREDFAANMPANSGSTVACIDDATAPAPPTVNDNCGNAITPTGPVTGGTFTSCEGTRTYTYTYTDCEGNSHPWVYTYTIEREDFTMPANGGSTVACIAGATPPVPPVVTDACGNTITPTGPTIGGNYTSCEGTRTYTWTYTDCEGNSHPWVYTWTIEREEFTVPAWGESTVSCITQFTQPTPPVVTDACGNVLTPTGPNLGVNYNGCEGTHTYSWTYTDCEGNTKDWAYTYTIDNNTAPHVTSTNSTFNPDIENYTCGVSHVFPAGQSACIINKSLAVPYWADDCGAVVSDDYVTNNGIVLSRINDIVIGNFPVGQTIVTFRAFDCANNMGTCTVSITVNDQQNPNITGCPTNKLGNADSGTCTKTFNLVVPTASDNCSVESVNYAVTGTTTLSGAEFPNELTFNVGLSTVTYTVYDPAGNTATCSFNVFVIDAQPLSITCPANTTVSTDAGICTYTVPGGAFDVAVSDNCPPASQVYTLTGVTAATGSGTLSGTLLNRGVTNIRWVVTDQGGIAKTCSFTVTVSDTEMPAVPADASSTVNCPSAMVAPTVPTGTDNCSATINGVLVSVVDSPSPLACEGTRTYTYSYTDPSGNTATDTWTYTYTLERNDFTMPADQGSTIGCISLAFMPSPPPVTDNCGAPVIPTGPAIGGTYTNCEGTRTFTWTYTDCEGNSHPWVYTYTIERNNFTVPANGSSTVACIAQAIIPAAPSVTDDCGNILTPTGPVVGGTYISCEGTRTYTYTYTDCEGNTHPWVYTYTIERNDFNMPANGGSTVACIAQATQPVPPVVNDNCGNPITPVGPTVGGTYTGCEGTRTYTWAYTDCEGNTHNWVYTWTIEREDFNMPANGASTVSCISQVTVPTPPVVNDNCGNPITPVGPTVSGTYTNCEGTRIYTWIYTDCEGNSHNWVYTYTIDNNTAPTVSSTLTTSNPDIEGYTCGSTFTYPAGQSACIINKSMSNPIWVDDCGSTVTTTLGTNNGVVLSQVSDVVVGNFPTGTTIVRFTGTDCAGNTGVCTVAVVVQDGQFPTITGCPPSTITTTTDQGRCDKVLNLVIPTAGDNCTVASVNYTSTGATSISGAEFPNQLTFNTGVTIVTYTVSDASGNTRSCTYSVTVIDNQPVTVSCPSSQTFNTNTGLCNYTSTGSLIPVVTDNCPIQGLTWTLSGSTLGTGSNTLTGTTFNRGLTMVTWRATDVGGSTATCSFFVSVLDREAPVVPADAGSTVNCPANAITPVVPTATDNCNNPVNGVLVSVTDSPSPLTCEGTRTYTYTYTDAAGNTAADTWVYTYTVNYNTPLVPPTSVNVQIACATGAINPGAPANIQDACGRTVIPVLVGSDNGANNTACSGTVTWRYRYTACDGTTADWTYTYNYQDNQAPVVALPSTGYSTCFQSETSAFATLLQASVVNDNCTGQQSLRSLATYQFVPYTDGNNCNDGNLIIRFYDECGNGPSILTFTGIKIDNVAPALVAFPNNSSQLICIDNLPVPNPAGVVASDNCDQSVDVVFVSDQLPTTCQGTVTRTYRLTDDCGNTRLVEQYFNVTNDRLAPVMTAGTLLASYPSVTQGQAAAIAATGIQDDCTPYNNLIIQTVVTGFCPATITVIATDQCGRSSQVTYSNVCLGDVLNLVTPASNEVVNCEDEQNALAAWLNSRGGAQVSGASVVWTHTPVQFGPVDCVTHSKSATVTFKAQSAYGAFVETSATFTVRDLQLPVAQNIPAQTLTCISQLPSPNPQIVVATDNCDNSLAITLFSSSSNGGNGCANNPRTELRTYSVTDDYCNTVYVSQMITAADNVPPTFTAPANITVNVGPNCSYNSSVSVTGDVTNESDNCSSGLSATFTDVTTQGGGQGIRYTISRTWRLTDNCGNAATPQVQVISVADSEPPILICPANISVSGATIGINSCAWRAVNATPVSTDNCGTPNVTYNITGSFTGASTGNKTINGVIFLEGVSTVTYTSTDPAGNVSTCSFTVTVNCTTISGKIIWEHNDVSGVKDATVRLRKGTLQVSSTLSDVNGNYTVVATSTGAHTITPVKNINRLNGVTAADATVILQHLNGTQLITDPYKKVAADVNRSGVISTQDANVITQALAGNASALAAFNVFWRFIPTTYVMPVTGPNVVASFPESITLNITGADVTGQNFFGVKLGDMNGSANPLALPTTGPLVWTVRDEVLQAGNEYELHFNTDGFNQLAAFQFGIDFDPTKVQFLGCSDTDAIPMNTDNFGTTDVEAGEFRVVWSSADGTSLTPGTNVFRLRFKALETGMKLSDVIRLDDKVLECLAFTESMAQGPVRLVFTTTTATDTPESSTAPQLQLLQNIPNPFIDVTTIGFILPDACEAVIRVTDVSGREITRYKRQYNAGYHEMEFRMENAAGYGILFCELITPFGTKSKKMITGSR